MTRQKQQPVWGSGTPSLEQVVLAATAYIDAHGLDAFTLRKLATEMGVFETVLYRKVKTKDALFDLVADAVLSEVRLPETQDWRAWLEGYALELRRVLHDHRHVALLLNTSVTPQPAMLDHSEQALTVLAQSGFKGDSLRVAFTSFAYYAIGGTVFEVTPRPWVVANADAAPLVDQVDTARYPLVTSIQQRLTDKFLKGPRDAWLDIANTDFLVGLRLLLDGLEALRTKERSRRRG